MLKALYILCVQVYNKSPSDILRTEPEAPEEDSYSESELLGRILLITKRLKRKRAPRKHFVYFLNLFDWFWYSNSLAQPSKRATFLPAAFRIWVAPLRLESQSGEEPGSSTGKAGAPHVLRETVEP